MPKLNYKTIILIPESRNFSEMHNSPNATTENEHFDLGDEGRAVDEAMSNMQADSLVLELLFRMDDRQKIIFMYQLLRESGYNLNHGDCAKTLSLTREHYMFLLKEVKLKAAKVLQESGI